MRGSGVAMASAKRRADQAQWAFSRFFVGFRLSVDRLGHGGRRISSRFELGFRSSIARGIVSSLSRLWADSREGGGSLPPGRVVVGGRGEVRRGEPPFSTSSSSRG